MGILDSMFGRRRGIVAGDNPQQEEWWRLIMKGDAGQEPMRNAPGRGGGILGNIAGRSMEDWGSRFGQAGAYFDGDWASGAAIGQARAEQGAKQREAQGAGVQQQALADAMRQEGYTDAQIMLAMQNLKAAGEAAVNKANPKPQEPTSQERLLSAATNWTPQQWETFDRLNPIINNGPTGQEFIPRSSISQGMGGPDATPIIEDGYQYTPGPGGRANQSNWKPAGGGVGNGTGGFPGRYRR